jgi:hypothetical protein
VTVHAGEDLDERRLAGAVVAETHVTSPAFTPTLMSFSATTLPKYFEMLRTSSSAVPFAVAVCSVVLIAALLRPACGCSC